MMTLVPHLKGIVTEDDRLSNVHLFIINLEFKVIPTPLKVLKNRAAYSLIVITPNVELNTVQLFKKIHHIGLSRLPPTSKSKVTKMVNPIIWAYNRIPILNENVIMFLNSLEWPIAIFKDVFVTKVS